MLQGQQVWLGRCLTPCFPEACGPTINAHKALDTLFHKTCQKNATVQYAQKQKGLPAREYVDFTPNIHSPLHPINFEEKLSWLSCEE